MLQRESDLDTTVTATTVIITIAPTASTEILHMPASLHYPSDAKALAQAAHHHGWASHSTCLLQLPNRR